MKKLFFTHAFLVLLSALSAQDAPNDSLKNHIRSLEAQPRSIHRDTLLNKSLNLLGRSYAYSAPDSAIHYSELALKAAEHSRWEQGIGASYHQMGNFATNKGDYVSALHYYDLALAVWNKLEKSDDPTLKAFGRSRKPRTLSAFGIVNDNLGNYPEALEYYLQALRIYEKLGEKKGQATTFGNIGLVYANQKEYEKALDFYNKALKLDTQLQNHEGVARHLGNMAIVLHEQEKYTESLDHYFRALELKEKYSNPHDVAYTLGNIGNLYGNLAEKAEHPDDRAALFDKALKFNNRALSMLQDMGDQNGIARNLGNLGILYSRQKKNSEAEKYLLQAIAICDSIGMLQEKMTFEKSLSEAYQNSGNYLAALKHHQIYSTVRDSIFNLEKDKEMTGKQLSYEFERKEAEQALKTKAEKEKILAVAGESQKKQQVIIFSVAGILLVVMVFSMILYSRFKLTKKQNVIIQNQKEEVERQKEMVDEKQKEIIDSINYAKRIQRALITNENYFEKHLRRLGSKF